MASELIVQTIQGPSSGANANKIIVPAGHTLAAAGHVVQVVQGQHAGEVGSSSDSFVHFSPLSVTITPTSTSSKILVSTNFEAETTSNSVRLYPNFSDGTDHNLINYSNGFGAVLLDTGTSGNPRTLISYSYLFSPNTTSPITYYPSFRSSISGTNVWVGAGSALSIITAMEIAG